MKRAVQLAYAGLCDKSDAGVSFAQVVAMVEQLTTLLSECSSCGGTGQLRVEGSPVHLGDGLSRQSTTVDAGSTMDCPTCQKSGLDPDHVRWTCVEDYLPCTSRSAVDGHEGCGYRVVLGEVDLEGKSTTP